MPYAPNHKCHHINSCYPSVKQYILTHCNTELILYTCSLFVICNTKVSRARAGLWMVGLWIYYLPSRFPPPLLPCSLPTRPPPPPPIQLNVGLHHVCVWCCRAALGRSYCLAPSDVWHWHNGGIHSCRRRSYNAPLLHSAYVLPRRIRFWRIVKKIRRSKHATNTHKHSWRYYLSDVISGDSQSHLKPEPLRSKDRALLSYNIEMTKS